tara:strand:+ start:265 stop:822 length:558 start_codon:yes stop_codon:yes gene_type:complete
MSYCNNQIDGGFTKKACILWMSYININTTYFEWGSGFTTVTADKIGAKVTSIEGSKDWYNKMIKKKFSNRTNLFYVDIGETGSFSNPKDPTKSHNYITSIKDKQDIILVDGRWRVACAIRAFPFISENGRLMIHDFHRKYYHSLLKIYQEESKVDSLAVMKPLKNISNLYLEKMFLNFVHNPKRV